MSQSSLFKHFPPPQFLNPERIGISFSDSSIKVVKFGSGATKFPVQTLLIPLDPGIVVGGLVVNAEELTKKIAQARNKFRSHYVSFTVPDESTYIFNASIPIMTSEDLHEGVAFTIEENVPLSLEDTVFDYVPIAIQPQASGVGSGAKVVVVASPKKEVESIISILRAAEFEPLGCLPESQAIAEAVIPKDFVGTAVVMHTRDYRIGIYLVKDKVVQFSTLRTITKDDYEKDLQDEYGKFLEYWSKYDTGSNHSIQAMFVCGEFEYARRAISAMSGSAQYPERALLANVWGNMFAVDEHMPELAYETSLSFAGAIGAAMSKI